MTNTIYEDRIDVGAPVKILKERFEGESRKFLIEWEGFPEVMQTWEDATQYEAREWQHLMCDFLTRSSQIKSNSYARRASETEDSGEETQESAHTDESQDQVWKQLELVDCSVTIMMHDQTIIKQGKPLFNGVIDYAMAILAEQTRKFRFTSCICPLTGYTYAIDDEDKKGHVSIHHCGESHLHWVTSFLQRPSNKRTKNTVWLTKVFENNKRMTAKVLTELTDLYFVQCPKELLNLNIHLIPMRAQTKKNTCGYIAIATAVEVAVGNTALEKLYSIQFDEDQMANWLMKCLEDGKFEVCPKKIPSTALKKNASNSYGKGYQLEEVELDFILLQEPARKNFKRLNRSKWGVANDKTGRGLLRRSNQSGHQLTSSMTTAPSQHGLKKLIIGCVIQLSYTVSTSQIGKPVGVLWTGNWMVTQIDVPNKKVQVRPVQDDNRRYVLPNNFHFRVVSPPCLVVEAFFTLDAYQLITDQTAVTLVYPVCEYRLSDVAFSSGAITGSVILEIVRCDNLQDIESMLTVMSGRRVWMYVRIQDFLPYRKLIRYVATLHDRTPPPHPPENVTDAYHKQLNWIMSRCKVRVLWPNEREAWGMYNMYNALSKLNIPVRSPFAMDLCIDSGDAADVQVPIDISVSTPLSAREKIFRAGTNVRVIQKWGIQKYGNEGRGEPSPRKALFCRSFVPDSQVLRTTVHNGKVIRQEEGKAVSENDHKLLIASAKSVIQQVGTISGPEAVQWTSYRFDMQLNKVKQGMLIKVSTWESVSMQKDLNDKMELKGIIAVGGCKVVVLALPKKLTVKDVRIVVLYKVRDPSSQSQRIMFRNDVCVHAHIQHLTHLEPSPYFLKQYHKWTSGGDLYAVVEKMDFHVRAGLQQLRMSFGKLLERNK
jgi:hypothetical protein